MSADLPDTPADELAGRPRGLEAAWERLWSQLRLSDGFWLGFLFGSDLAVVRELERRSAQLLRGEARGVDARHVPRPPELRDVLPWLLTERSASTGLVWVVGLAGDPRGWLPAWDGFLRRLNEQREALRRALRCGLVLVGSPGLLAVARDAAPDLWSYRSMLIELPTAPPVGVGRPQQVGAHVLADDDHRAFAERAVQPPIEPSPELRPMLQRVSAEL